MASSKQFLQPIRKLRGRDNYLDWSWDMQNYLEHEKLWDAIEAPPNGSLSKDEEKNMLARTSINMSVEPVAAAHIRGEKSAQKAWQTLKSVYADNDAVRRLNLLWDLIIIKLEECSSTDTYVSRKISLAKELSSTGLSVPDEWLALLLLAGLPKQYKSLVMTLRSASGELKSSEVKSQILSEVQWQQNQSDSSSFYTRSSQPSNSRGRPWHQNRGRRGFPPNKRYQNIENIQCLRCNGYGHYARDCPTGKKFKSVADKVETFNTDKEYDSDDDNPFTRAFCVSTAIDKRIDKTWLIDSCASAYMSYNEALFDKIRKSNVQTVKVADNKLMKVFGEGDMYLNIKQNGHIFMRNVLYIPNLSENLLSVGRFDKDGYNVSFGSGTCNIYDGNKNLIVTGSLLRNCIYKLNILENEENICNIALQVLKTIGNMEPTKALQYADTCLLTADVNKWHRRRGHVNYNYMNQLKSGAATRCNFSGSPRSCPECVVGKMSKKLFRPSVSRDSEKLQLVHSDLCEVDHLSIGNAKYFLTFIDYFSRKTFIYLKKKKVRLLNVLKILNHMLKMKQIKKF